MTSIVPQSNHRLGPGVFIAKHTQARGTQHDVAPAPRSESEPADGEYPQEMPTRKKQHVPLDTSHPIHHPVCPGGYLIRRFAARAAVTEQLPFRALSMDLGGATPLVLAIVPFEEVAIDFRRGPEAGQVACLGCTLQRTGQHLDER